MIFDVVPCLYLLKNVYRVSHLKCYLNEKEAIITSMNLYDFSQVNNNEMGIHVIKNEDAELYEEVYKEARRLIRDSDEIEITVTKKPKKSVAKKKGRPKKEEK